LPSLRVLRSLATVSLLFGKCERDYAGERRVT
jgi:hypothetical protein